MEDDQEVFTLRGILGPFASPADLTVCLDYSAGLIHCFGTGCAWGWHKAGDTGPALEDDPDNQAIITPSKTGT